MGTRLTAQQRKHQLIGIGLRLLTTAPLDEFSLDQVAQEAGISRSLLFHHFPTKRDYYLAVVGAASRRMLHATQVPSADPARPGHRDAGDLRIMVDGMVAFIRRRREPYLAFVRGSAGGDAAVREIQARTKDELIARFAAAAGVDDDDALGRLQVRGWLAYAEEMVLTWTGERPGEDDAVLAQYLLTALDSLLHP